MTKSDYFLNKELKSIEFDEKKEEHICIDKESTIGCMLTETTHLRNNKYHFLPGQKYPKSFFKKQNENDLDKCWMYETMKNLVYHKGKISHPLITDIIKPEPIKQKQEVK